MGKTLEPLERVDTGVNLPTRVRSRLEPQLAPSHTRRRLVLSKPPIVPAPKRRLFLGHAQCPRRANIDQETTRRPADID